jgi:hypothetical protein
MGWIYKDYMVVELPDGRVRKIGQMIRIEEKDET